MDLKNDTKSYKIDLQKKKLCDIYSIRFNHFLNKIFHAKFLFVGKKAEWNFLLLQAQFTFRCFNLRAYEIFC